MMGEWDTFIAMLLLFAFIKVFSVWWLLNVLFRGNLLAVDRRFAHALLLSRIPTNLMIFFDFGVIENQDSALPVGMKGLIGSLSVN